jgi:hypothetical protein
MQVGDSKKAENQAVVPRAQTEGDRGYPVSSRRKGVMLGAGNMSEVGKDGRS